MMHVVDVEPQGWLRLAVPVAIFLVILAFRARGMAKVRPLRVERLWVIPTIFLALSAASLIQSPPGATGWGLCVVGLVLGGAAGWQRGKLMRITLDPSTLQLDQKASAAGLAFIVVLVGLRVAVRAEADALDLDPGALGDMLVLFAFALFSAQRIEMYLRARRMLNQQCEGRQ